MRISTQNKQLIKIAGSINLFFLLLCVIFLLYLGNDTNRFDIARKVVKFVFSNSLCWIINLTLLIIVPPQENNRRRRALLFYLPSFILTSILAILIAASPIYAELSDDKIDHPISGPIFFVLGINTLSLVAIELILSLATQANIKVQYAHMQSEMARLQIKSLEAQHEKLKNQLHPHFLFNSLSALKSLIRRDPALAEQYLVRLSGFLRFSISHNEQNTVPLNEEVKFSIDYLEMQQIRFRGALQYTMDIPLEALADTFLPVFSLQLVLENAIKHNRLTQEQPLCIGIRYLQSGWLLVENNIQKKLSADPASGIGLKNLSDRYELLAQETIRIENDSDLFKVFLKVIRP